MFDPQRYRPDFPILQRRVHGEKSLVYLDNAATSQKPNQVIDAISNYYRTSNANVHRGVHQLGDESTRAFHESRRSIAEFFGATAEELIVVRNTTEAINQVVYSWADQHIKAGQVILTTEMEHHSNIVPWQQLAQQRCVQMVYIPVLEDGKLDQEAFQQLLKKHEVAVFACSHVSNTLGTKNPVEEMSLQLKRVHPQAKVVIDGAQAAPHLPLHFDASQFDFYAVSAHKMLGPMGVGGLFVKKELVEEFSPFLFGGGMIDQVSLEHTSFAEDLEDRFTAGTPDVAGLVGWAAACEYLESTGMSELLKHDRRLVQYAIEQLKEVPEVQLVGITNIEELEQRIGAVTFVYKDVHAHDVGQILDSEGVAVRTGHHCTMPLHKKFGWQATVRASFQLYNTVEEIDVLVNSLDKVKKVFSK
jgi:cysteine desulfurase / selenocysteine lyase